LNDFFISVLVLENFAKTQGLNVTKGRKAKVKDWEIAAAFIISYLTNMPVLKFFQLNINQDIRSYHIFRRYRIKRVYRLLREFMKFIATIRLMILMIIKKGEVRLIIDGTIIDVSNVNRAKTHKIRRFSGKKYWVKRDRKLYSPHYKKRIRVKELHYGILVMVICDEDGYVYDIWYTYGSKHEKRAYEERKKRSSWFRYLVEKFEIIGDKGYRGIEEIKISYRKGEKKIRQKVETLIGGIKGFYYSRWRKGITLLTYLYGYALGFSILRPINSFLKS